MRDLGHVVTREKAAIGVLITLEEPTKPMRKEAANGEFYLSSWGPHPVLQILTIKELLDGKGINRPPTKTADATFKKAPKAKAASERAGKLGFD